MKRSTNAFCQGARGAVNTISIPIAFAVVSTRWIRYYRNGQRFSESSHSTKKSDAITLLKQREEAIANGEPVTSKISRFMFAEAAADLLTEYRINNRRSTDEAARRIRKHLEPFFGGRRMTSINAADVRSYVAQRQAATEIVKQRMT